MVDGSHVPADGDKQSNEQITSIHVQHPGIGTLFTRSTLLIATRGAGKTFLLRHRKQTTHPSAVYLNLHNCLKSFSTAGLGGKTLNYGVAEASQVRAKTAALVAISVLSQLLRDRHSGVERVSFAHLAPVLPESVRRNGRLDVVSLDDVRRQVDSLRLAAWQPGFDASRLLTDVLTEVNDLLSDHLVLFLDRAEDVPSPAVQLLLPLLDQSIPFLVVIAARPGLIQLLPTELDPTLVAGDHFEVVHLGVFPYSSEWQKFSQTATRNFLDANGYPETDPAVLQWASLIGRDSIRLAAELAQHAFGTSGLASLSTRADRIVVYRDSKLETIRAQMQPEHPDFPGFIRAVQRRLGRSLASGPYAPVEITLKSHQLRMPLLGARTALTDFVLKAIRHEALYLPEGESWHPLSLPRAFEIPPLLIWNEEIRNGSPEANRDD